MNRDNNKDNTSANTSRSDYSSATCYFMCIDTNIDAGRTYTMPYTIQVPGLVELPLKNGSKIRT